jgi:sulfopyruvate decarboxylase subunit beta
VGEAKQPEGQQLKGGAIIDAIKAGGIRIIVSVPDITTSHGLLWPISRDPSLRHIRVCKEDEGVSICAALSYCNQRAMLVIQNTGFFDSVNALRGIAVEYQHPVCMIIGLQGAEPDVMPDQSAKYSVRIVGPMLDVMNIERHSLRETADTAAITPAVNRAYANSRPVAFVIGRSPV